MRAIFIAIVFCCTLGSAIAGIKTVTTTDDDGPGSLREAISSASAGDVIIFSANLKGDTIVLESRIDFTQGNLNIQGDIDGDNIPDIIVRDLYHFNNTGFQFSSENNIVSGLVFQNFYRPLYFISGGNNNQVLNCYVGVGIDGLAGDGTANRYGVYLRDAVVGNLFAGEGENQRNIISNNDYDNVYMLTTGTQNDISIPAITSYDSTTNFLTGTGDALATLSLYLDPDYGLTEYLGSVSVPAGAGWSFPVDLDTLPDNYNIVAVQTLANNSSEFSQPYCRGFIDNLAESMVLCEDSVSITFPYQRPYNQEYVNVYTLQGNAVVNTYDSVYLIENLSLGMNSLEFVLYSGVGGNCRLVDTIDLFLDIASLYEGDDQTVSEDTAVLNASNAVDGVDGPIDFKWQVLSGSGVFDDDTLGSSLVRGLTLGINEFIWTATPEQACYTQDTVVISYVGDSIPVDAGEDIYTCNGQAQLNGSLAWEHPLYGLLNATWVDPLVSTAISFSGNEHDAVVTISGTGTYDIIRRISDGQGLLVYEDTLTVTNENAPWLYQEYVSSCGDTARYDYGLDSGFTGSWEHAWGDASIIEANDSLIRLDDINGQNLFWYTVERGQCVLRERVQFTRQEVPVFEMGNDTLITEGFALTDSLAFYLGDQYYEFYGYSVLSGAARERSAFDSVYFAELVGDVNSQVVLLGYYFEGYGAYGRPLEGPQSNGECIAYDTMVVTIVPDIFAYNDTLLTLQDLPDTSSYRSNDFVYDQSEHSATIISGPFNGSHQAIGVNQDVYTPNLGFSGIDSIQYEIRNDAGIADTAWVYYDVLDFGINAEMLAIANSVDTIGVALIENDVIDPSIVYTVQFSSLSNANAVLIPNGDSLEYAANGFIGEDLITTTVCATDYNFCLSVVDTLAIPNFAPVAVHDTVSLFQGESLNIQVLSNDSDFEMHDLAVSILDGPTSGSAFVTANDSVISFTTDLSFVGIDTITYQVCDDYNDCSMAYVFIQISDSNFTPIIGNELVVVQEPGNAFVALLENDIDYDNDPMSVSIIDVGQKLNIDLVADTLFLETIIGQIGFDTIVYEVCDTAGACAQGLVYVNVLDSNFVPVFVLDTIGTNPDQEIRIAIKDIANEYDGELLIAGINLLPNNGTATIVNDTLVYQPDLAFSGVDSLELEVCDGTPYCATQTIYFSVIDINYVPNTQPDYVSVTEAGSAVVIPLSNDSDLDFDPLTITTILDSGEVVGWTLVDDTLYVTSQIGDQGTDLIVYEVCDTAGGCFVDSIYVTIVDSNFVPIASGDTLVTDVELVVGVNVSQWVIDHDNENLFYTLVTAPSNGTAQFVGDSLTYLPNVLYVGLDSMAYEVCDGASQCDTAYVFVEVEDINRFSVGDGEDTIRVCNQYEITIDLMASGDTIFGHYGIVDFVNSPGVEFSHDIVQNKFLIRNILPGLTTIGFHYDFTDGETLYDTVTIKFGLEYDPGESVNTCLTSYTYTLPDFDAYSAFDVFNVTDGVSLDAAGLAGIFVFNSSVDLSIRAIDSDGCISSLESVSIGVSPEFSAVDDSIYVSHSAEIPLYVFNEEDTVFVSDTLYAVQLLDDYPFNPTKTQSVEFGGDSTYLTYTPHSEFSGIDTVRYLITNLCNTDTAIGEVIVVVSPVVVQDDVVQVSDYDAVSISVNELVLNDLGKILIDSFQLVSEVTEFGGIATVVDGQIIVVYDTTYLFDSIPGGMPIDDRVAYFIYDENEQISDTAYVSFTFKAPAERLTEEVSVGVQSVKVNQILTPNGDGVNDYLQFEVRLESTEDENGSPVDSKVVIPADISLTVFTKWGDVVYTTDDYDESDPEKRFSGVELAEGTYYYSFEFEIDEAVNDVNRDVFTATGFFMLFK